MIEKDDRPSGHQPLDHAALLLTAGDADSHFTYQPSDSSAERFDLIPPFGTPRVLVPINPRSRRAAIELFAGRSVERFSHRAAVRAAPLLSAMSPRSRVELTTVDSTSMLPMRSFISDALDRSDFELVVRLGAARPNGKLVVAAVDNEAGRALAFFKFGQRGITDHLVRHESEVLQQLATADLPVVIPEVLYAGMWSEMHVLATRAIDATRLPDDSSHPHRIADAIAASSASFTARLAVSPNWIRTKQRADGVRTAKAAPLLSVAIDFVEQTWGDRSIEHARGHGDWIRPNLGACGGRLIALDWERSEPDLPRGLDNAHFSLFDVVRSRRMWRRLSAERVAAATEQAISNTDLWAGDAPLLATLNLIEMVLRFAEAEMVGVDTPDRSYAPLLVEMIDQHRPTPSTSRS